MIFSATSAFTFNYVSLNLLIMRKVTTIVFFVCVFLMFTVAHCAAQNYEAKIDSVCKAHKIAPFTTKLIIAHAKVESGNFTNNLVKNHNNLFGMKHPSVRPTKSTGGKARAEGRTGYAEFKTDVDSIIDYLLWLEYHNEVRIYKTTDQYVAMLKKHSFFGSTYKEYYNAMKSFL
jgi:uncharacterized FlgJ-related protein